MTEVHWNDDDCAKWSLLEYTDVIFIPGHFAILQSLYVHYGPNTHHNQEAKISLFFPNEQMNFPNIPNL